jgi:hypothetical protein
MALESLGGTRRPLYQSIIWSEVPTTFAPITGFQVAIVSVTTRPHPSWSEGTTTTSLAA